MSPLNHSIVSAVATVYLLWTWFHGVDAALQSAAHTAAVVVAAAATIALHLRGGFSAASLGAAADMYRVSFQAATAKRTAAGRACGARLAHRTAATATHAQLVAAASSTPTAD